MVLTVSFVLSPVTGLVCHRRSTDMVLSKPGRADLTSANLTPASGVRTTRLRRTQQHLSSACCRSLTGSSPALQSRCAQNAAASTASAPRVRDDRDTPLVVGWDARSSRSDLGCVKTEIFLQRGLDTKLPDGQITAARANSSRVPDAVQRSPGDANGSRECAPMTGSASSGHAAPRGWRAGSCLARFESRPNRCLQSAKPDNRHFRD